MLRKVFVGLAIVVAGVVGRTVLRFLQRKKRCHIRPTLTSLLDSVCEIFAFLKIGPWANGSDIHYSMKTAMEQTGLSDWGTKDNFDFAKRYDIVRTVGLEKSKARYSPIGHYYVQKAQIRRMANRLQMVKYMKMHPQVEQIKMKAPVFVIGFPRTGTTFLHEMLGLHELVRMHYTWEQMEPIPLTDKEGLDDLKKEREIRYKKNLSYFNTLFSHVVSPKIQDIHRVGYDEPEECTTPCAAELPWNVFELPFNPFAIDELVPLGAGDAFKFYRMFLKIMEFQSEDRRGQDFTWMLKCPFHLPYLDALHKEFPDATVVWTHRDPTDCIVSACSLYEVLLCACMEEWTIDKKALGKAVLNYTRRCLDLAEQTIERLGSKFKILHIKYQETIKTPKDACRKVYDKAGLPFTGEYEGKLDAYLKNSEEQRRKVKERNKSAEVHVYRPEEYGLTADQIRAEFADYIKRRC